MATDVIGAVMDIHSGGMDLKFPHHDNELAQSEAALGTHQWVNHFWHAGHLSIKGLKMSKSLKNFITIRQLLASYTPQQVRLLFLLSPWEAGINFSEDGLAAAKAKEAELNEFFLNTQVALRARRDTTNTPQHWTADDRRMSDALQTAQTAVHAALCDNFDYPTAMQLLSQLVQDTNRYRGREDAKRGTLLAVVRYVDRMVGVFGLKGEGGEDFGFTSAGGSSHESTGLLDVLCAFRDDIRATAREWKGRKGEEAQGLNAVLAACDRLRDERLIDLGVRIEDPTDVSKASVWKKEDPAKLRHERAVKAREEAAARVRGLEAKLLKAQKEKERLEEGRVGAKELFAQQTDKWGRWAEDGRPTHDREGKELGKSTVKTVEKVWAAREKGHKEWREKLDKNPRLMEDVQEEVQRLQQQKTAAELELQQLKAE